MSKISPKANYFTHSPLSSAVWTGLEPATPCVTGRYSNQLNYHTISLVLCSGEALAYRAFASAKLTNRLGLCKF